MQGPGSACTVLGEASHTSLKRGSTVSLGKNIQTIFILTKLGLKSPLKPPHKEEECLFYHRKAALLDLSRRQTKRKQSYQTIRCKTMSSLVLSIFRELI